MSISVNGQSQVPPGFRFHPTEEELLQYYLRKKVSNQKLDLDVIRDVNLNKLEPWDIQEMCRIGSTAQSEWYFFSHKDKKYPTGTRRNRATSTGFWKATGRDKVIYGSNSKRIGMRKTLVFYQGRAPHGHKADWIMHEYYRLHDIIHCTNTTMTLSDAKGEATQEEGWVVCRIFKKKLNHKTLDTSMNLTAAINYVDMTHSSSSENGTLEQIFQDFGRTTCKINQHHDRSSAMKLKLPILESPNPVTSQHLQPQMLTNDGASNSKANSIYNESSEIGRSEWTIFDQQLVASQLIKDQSETSIKQPAFFNDPSMALICYSSCHDLQLQTSSNRPFNGIDSHHDNDVEFNLWSFTPSSPYFADPLMPYVQHFCIISISIGG